MRKIKSLLCQNRFYDIKINPMKLQVEGISQKNKEPVISLNSSNNNVQIENPLEHLLACLCVCEMHVIRHYAYIENKKVNDIKLIKCESEYDLRGYKKEIPSNKNILNEIYIDFEIDSNMDQEYLAGFKIRHELACPINNMLQLAGCKISSKWIHKYK